MKLDIQEIERYIHKVDHARGKKAIDLCSKRYIKDEDNRIMLDMMR